MKKILALILTVVMSLTMLASCRMPAHDDGKIRVMTTIFPVYDWVRNILSGDESFEVELLCDNGVDMHNFQPTAEDIININTCDIFIYVGGESDEWVDEVLSNSQNDDILTVNLLDTLGDLAIAEDEDEPDELDEHIWMSLTNACYLVTALADDVFAGLSSDPDKIFTNSRAYVDELTALDADYQNAVDNASRTSFVVGDRYPFRYLSNDYNLTYYAAFDGCSAETEASFETVLNLADHLNDIGASCVVITESSDGNIAASVIDVAGVSDASTVVLNSLQSVSRADIDSGVTYISLMESNLTALETALNGYA